MASALESMFQNPLNSQDYKGKQVSSEKSMQRTTYGAKKEKQRPWGPILGPDSQARAPTL